MYDTTDDIVSAEETTNYKYSADGKKQMQLERLDMQDYNFFPSLDVTLMNDSPMVKNFLNDLGIFKNGQVVLERLNQYITIVL